MRKGGDVFRLGLAGVTMCAALLPLACQSGDISLRNTEGSQTETGGSMGDDEGSGGTGEGEGGAWPDGPMTTPMFPCLLSGNCDTFCSEDRPGCTPCDDDRDCPLVVSYCDASLDRCVECLDDHDCEHLFGDFFDECSAGRCVQCQRDDHCPGDLRCEGGWCGSCDDDGDCPRDFDCFQNRCVPETL